ncbi:MAG: hypothetical protein AABZ08_05605 [Planctomycetota bacterium]
MDRVFPFCYPAPTAFYLSAYMASLLVHLVFMQYVLAGSAYLVFGRFLDRPMFGARQRGSESPSDDFQPDVIHETLRDWLPFATSAAITAGVAPLLFLQILYRKSFYTANLLLFHRWMAIVPVLIVGFYLLYLLKTERIRRGPAWKESAIALTALACFGFTAWSWTENHMLSLDAKSWAEVYQRGELMHHTPGAYLRTLGWFLSSFPAMLLLVAWQIHGRRSDIATASRRLTYKLAGLANLMLIFGTTVLLYAILLKPTPAPHESHQGDADAYAWLLASGMIIQLLGWMFQSRLDSLRRNLLLVCTVGQLAVLISIVAVRELGRVARIDMGELSQAHADAFRVAGLPIFIFFLIFNAALVAWCIRVATRGPRPTRP